MAPSSEIGAPITSGDPAPPLDVEPLDPHAAMTAPMAVAAKTAGNLRIPHSFLSIRR
jgi:hypothetical protein